jgi:PPOX class probable F420-dependent enzyme
MTFSIDTGSRAAGRLRQEAIAWLVSVSPAGAPQPSPVWFVWDDAGFLLYSQPDTPKLRNIEANPRVALHLDDDGRGGDIVIVSGRATVSDDPPATGVPAYLDKYAPLIARNGWTPESFAADYSVPVRIAPRRLREG